MNEEHESHQSAAGLCKGTPERLKDYKTPDYDMSDSEEEIDHRWPELAHILRDCRENVLPTYDDANRDALRNQTWHKWLVFVAATFGMLAVLFAIFQLSPLSPRIQWAGVIEFAAAGLAVVAVGLGLVAAYFTKWLFEREKAERCRVLKFLYLISPELWSGRTPEERQGLLRDRVKLLQTSDRKDLERWVRGEDAVLEEASSAVPANLGKDVFARLLDYYLEKRLCYQKHYFDRQARRRHSWEKFTRTAPVFCFFLSIVAALVHFVYDLFESSSHTGPDAFSLTLLGLAACLPVAGVAVRTLHTAHEFSRNALRFESTSGELEQLARELEEAKLNPQAKLEVLHRVEDSLRSERREWMRLMREAKWFG